MLFLLFQRAGIVISEADTETLFFYVERTYGGPSALELSGTTLRKALGLPISAAAQQLLDKQIKSSIFAQMEDDEDGQAKVQGDGQLKEQQQYKAWQHTHSTTSTTRGDCGGGLLSPDQRKACNVVAAKANTIIKLCRAVDSAGEGEVPWRAFSEAMTKAGILLRPDELEVVRRTILGNPPTVRDPVMVNEYESGSDAAEAVGVEWGAPIVYPSIVFKLRSLLEEDQRTPEQPGYDPEAAVETIGGGSGGGARQTVQFANDSDDMAVADRAMTMAGTPYEARPPRDKIDGRDDADHGKEALDFQEAIADDTEDKAAVPAASAHSPAGDNADTEPYEGYDGGGPGKLDVLARAPGGIALAFTGAAAEEPLEGEDANEKQEVDEAAISPGEVKGTLAYYAAKRARAHGPLPSQKSRGQRQGDQQLEDETSYGDMMRHKTASELADRERGRRHTAPERAWQSPSRAGVLSNEYKVYDDSGAYNFTKLGRNFADASLHPSQVSGDLPLAMDHGAEAHEGDGPQFKNHQGQPIKGRGRSTGADGRSVNDSREFEHAMLVKLGGQNGLGVGDEDDVAFREAVRRSAPEELAREAARWRHRRAVALQTLTQQRAILAGVFRRVDATNSGVLNVAGLADLLRSPGLDLALSADDYAVGNIDGALRLAAELVNSANEEAAEQQTSLDRSVGAFVEALDFNQLMRVVSREARATMPEGERTSSHGNRHELPGNAFGSPEHQPSAGAPSELMAASGGLSLSSSKKWGAVAEPASTEAMDAVIAEKIRGTVSWSIGDSLHGIFDRLRLTTASPHCTGFGRVRIGNRASL